jgi:hypothetical protein
VSLHGVGLSLGSTDPLNREHLRHLKRLVDRVEPALVSEHVSWGSVAGEFLNDLLPLPATAEALQHMVDRVAGVQDYLGRQILVENVSSYVEIGAAEMTEWDFLTRLSERAGCLILLDVNNIYVSGRNHGFDPLEYLNAIPVSRVAEMHLAGHSVVSNGAEDLLIDTHDAPVAAAVWDLYAAAVSRFGSVATLLEWDSRLPSLPELVAEAHKADARMQVTHARVA